MKGFDLRIAPDSDDPFDFELIPQVDVRAANRETHKRLDAGLDDADDPLGLNAIWAAYSDKREWIEDSAVALIHEQECSACGTISSFSMGWFTGKHHSRDRTARQLVAGKPVGYFPVVVERVKCPTVPVCSACAEAQALIENAAGRIEDSP